MLHVVEYTDPACPWAWGSEPTFLWLRRALAGRVVWRRVFGILFDDTDDPPPDAQAETRWYARWLAGVTDTTGAPGPLRLQRVCASSWPASLVARAAEEQGHAVAERVLRRLRETTFVDGVPADTLEAALDAVAYVRDLDTRRLRAWAADPAVRESVRADHSETRAPDPRVEDAAAPGPHPGRVKELPDGSTRYALPTLRVSGPAGDEWLPGWRPIEDYVRAISRVDPGTHPQPAVERVEDLLDELGSVTSVDLRLLAGDARPRAGAVRIATRGGSLWRPI